MANEEITTQGRTTQAAARTGAENAPAEVVPAVDIFENDDELLLVADLPGVETSGLSVELDPPELRIRGRQADFDRQLGEPVEFRRAFRVDDRIDPASISAKLEQGVLEVKLGKSAAVKPRRIAVRSG